MSLEVTSIDEELIFKIITPTGLILEVPAEHMPKGWQVWTVGIRDIASHACNRIGLPVTVERREICTARPIEP